MQNEILTVKDLNRYLPAIKTNEDMAFTNKLHEGLFLADPIDGLANIPDESIDLIITEPTMQPKSNSLSGNSPTFENYVDWVDGWLEESKRVLTPNGSIYIICPWQSSSMYHSVLEKKFNVQSRITAERKSEQEGLSQWKNTISDIWFATKTNDYIFNQNYIVDGKNINSPNPEEIKNNLWFHLDYDEIIHRILKGSSFKLNWVLDPFMGIGSVGSVAKKIGRRFIGFESNQDQLLLAMKTINEGE
ncbi:MAG: DNA-methyltransferase [Candidatus Neomarinimicrobiota bacterium]|tara:strand:- start:1444 stop:2181 length:738 start_codon:yes stop_codon:yes gene_type:complete